MRVNSINFANNYGKYNQNYNQNVSYNNIAYNNLNCDTISFTKLKDFASKPPPEGYMSVWTFVKENDLMRLDVEDAAAKFFDIDLSNDDDLNFIIHASLGGRSIQDVAQDVASMINPRIEESKYSKREYFLREALKKQILEYRNVISLEEVKDIPKYEFNDITASAKAFMQILKHCRIMPDDNKRFYLFTGTEKQIKDLTDAVVNFRKNMCDDVTLFIDDDSHSTFARAARWATRNMGDFLDIEINCIVISGKNPLYDAKMHDTAGDCVKKIMQKDNVRVILLSSNPANFEFLKSSNLLNDENTNVYNLPEDSDFKIGRMALQRLTPREERYIRITEEPKPEPRSESIMDFYWNDFI